MSIVFTLHNGSIVRCESAGGHDAWTPKLLLDAFATAVAELSGRPADGVKVNVALDAADRVVFTADIPEGRIQSEPMTLPRRCSGAARAVAAADWKELRLRDCSGRGDTRDADGGPVASPQRGGSARYANRCTSIPVKGCQLAPYDQLVIE
jgi:hypothetical protein